MYTTMRGSGVTASANATWTMGGVPRSRVAETSTRVAVVKWLMKKADCGMATRRSKRIIAEVKVDGITKKRKM